jgi:transposase
MDRLHSRCCDLDVHKSSVSACILVQVAGRVQRAEAVRGDASSDGVQRRLLEASVEHPRGTIHRLARQCATHQELPGHKTDQKDAEWIAQLLQHSLLRPSYVPCEIICDLRDLTRMRASLSQEASRISSRVQKVLEDANVKLASVATNTVGKNGRAMLEEIIAGQNDPEHLASLALGHLGAKTTQLRLALEGKIRPHHRFLLRRLLEQLRFVEHEIVC